MGIVAAVEFRDLLKYAHPGRRRQFPINPFAVDTLADEFRRGSA
jgi:hypothetical protein